MLDKQFICPNVSPDGEGAIYEITWEPQAESDATVWHYTNRRDLIGIVSDGKLKSKQTLLKEGKGSMFNLDFLHDPVIWFSKEQLWEPDAGKRPNGKLLSAREMEFQLGPLYRLGIPYKKVLCWPELMVAARYPDWLRKILEWDDPDGHDQNNHCGIVADYIPLAEIEDLQILVDGEWLPDAKYDYLTAEGYNWKTEQHYGFKERLATKLTTYRVEP